MTVGLVSSGERCFSLAYERVLTQERVMETLPSRREILERYRDVIGTEDFEILVQQMTPTPAEVSARQVSFAWLGPLRGYWLFLRRTAQAIAVVIIAAGNIESGLQFVERLEGYTPAISAYIRGAGEANGELADTFILSKDVSPQERLPDAPPRREYFAFTGTPTGTTTPVIQFLNGAVPPGSGLVPASKGYLRLT
jgi:hypothetical protein